MSRKCDLCGFIEPLPFTCKFCGNAFCYNHRLPESHACPGLVLYQQKIRDTGKIYHYEPDMKNRGTNTFAALSGFISLMKSNYSLAILTISIISFFLEIIPGYFSFFALSPVNISSRPWTLITHMFLHAGPFHLLFNMMFLFFIGTELERRIGGKMFLKVYFLSGIIAGIGYSFWSIFVLNNPYASAVGASGALFGVFACLAILAPQIRLYLFFIPVPVKITHALILFAFFDLIFIGAGDSIARSAHLSGVLAGLFMANQIKKSRKYIPY